MSFTSIDLHKDVLQLDVSVDSIVQTCIKDNCAIVLMLRSAQLTS